MPERGGETGIVALELDACAEFDDDEMCSDVLLDIKVVEVVTGVMTMPDTKTISCPSKIPSVGYAPELSVGQTVIK